MKGDVDINYSKIIPLDIANGKGIRVSLFVSGCNFHCGGCFNEEAQAFDYGKQYTEKTEQEIFDLVKNPVVRGLSILGGDPLCQDLDGLRNLFALVCKVQSFGKDVWLWSGYRYEDIIREKQEALKKTMYLSDSDKRAIIRYNIIQNCNVFVDGTFQEQLKDLSLPFRGSSNQRLINIENSSDNDIVLFDV